LGKTLLGSVEIVDTSIGGVTGTVLSGHTGHTTGSATSLLVDSHHDGVVLLLDFLLLGLELISGCLFGVVDELKALVGKSLNKLDVFLGELTAELLVHKGGLHLEAVRFETVLGLNSLLDLLVLVLELLSLLHHLLDVLLSKATLVVGDGDLLGLAGSLVHGVDVQDTIGIKIEGNLNLRGTTGSWGDTLKVELTEEVAVLGHTTLTLEDLDEDTGLVVSVGGEGLGLLGGDDGVSGDEDGHDTTGGLDTLGKGNDVEEEEILDLLGLLTVKDSSLDGGTVGNGLVGVDGSVKSLSVEEVGEHLLNLGDTGGATNKDNLVDLGLSDIGILKDLLNWGHALSEVVGAKFLELGTGKSGGVVLTVSEGLALNFSLMGTGKNSLCLLALGTEATESAGVASDVDAGLLLEVSHAVLDDFVVEIFTTEMSVTVGGLDLENTFVNSEEGDIESATTEIEDENVLLTLTTLLVEAVSDSGGGGFVNDTLDVET
jgi:hypothetical protein